MYTEQNDAFAYYDYKLGNYIVIIAIAAMLLYPPPPPPPPPDLNCKR
jgi:hypothetical protein